MDLTRTPKENLMQTYPIDNSPSALRFFKKLFDTYGIVAEAVYLQSDCLIDDSEKSIERILRVGHTDFVNELGVSLYIHAGHSRSFTPNEQWKRDVLSLFLETLEEDGMNIEYPRSYHPRELTYYGYRHGCFAREPIPTAPAKRERQWIDISYIDHLALWHILSGIVDRLNRLPDVIETGAKLYCDFDHGVPRPLALFYGTPKGDAARAMADRLGEVIYIHAKARDVWDAVTPENTRPMLSNYASLTPEQRFALERG